MWFQFRFHIRTLCLKLVQFVCASGVVAGAKVAETENPRNIEQFERLFHQFDSCENCTIFAARAEMWRIL